ncbi:MAG: hypothetical protein U0871_16240 [Gemmataceae bacterium]
MGRLLPRRSGKREPLPAFATACHERLTLYHPTPWPHKQPPQQFLIACSLAVIDLAELFGFTFPRPVGVYLFPTADGLSRYFGLPDGSTGCALQAETSIAVAGDAADLLAVVRHELAHLYADAWGPYPPAFKGEGLAVWCEYNRDPVAMDRIALWAVKQLGHRPPLADLLDDARFYDPVAAGMNYYLAGSFTRWVVRQRGWVTYRDFYRTATPGNYAAEFVAHFGLTVAAAEKGWHRHLAAHGG